MNENSYTRRNDGMNEKKKHWQKKEDNETVCGISQQQWSLQSCRNKKVESISVHILSRCFVMNADEESCKMATTKAQVHTQHQNLSILFSLCLCYCFCFSFAIHLPVCLARLLASIELVQWLLWLFWLSVCLQFQYYVNENVFYVYIELKRSSTSINWPHLFDVEFQWLQFKVNQQLNNNTFINSLCFN